MKRHNLLNANTSISLIPSVEVFEMKISLQWYTLVKGWAIEDNMEFILFHLKKFCTCGAEIERDNDRPDRQMITLRGAQSTNVKSFLAQLLIDDKIKSYGGKNNAWYAPVEKMIYIDLDSITVDRLPVVYTKLDGLTNQFKNLASEDKIFKNFLEALKRKFSSECLMIGASLYVEGDCRADLCKLLIGQGDRDMRIFKLLRKMSLDGFVRQNNIRIFGIGAGAGAGAGGAGAGARGARGAGAGARGAGAGAGGEAGGAGGAGGGAGAGARGARGGAGAGAGAGARGAGAGCLN